MEVTTMPSTSAAPRARPRDPSRWSAVIERCITSPSVNGAAGVRMFDDQRADVLERTAAVQPAHEPLRLELAEIPSVLDLRDQDLCNPEFVAQLAAELVAGLGKELSQHRDDAGLDCRRD